MATLETRAIRPPGPPRVADEFVLELRTRSARVPAEPVRPRTVREVAVAVAHAYDEGHELALDLSGLKRIVVDPQERTACVQAGVTAAELEEAAAHWDFAPGRLLAAHVVMPHGELVAADADDLPDCAIVVEAVYGLRELPELRN